MSHAHLDHVGYLPVLVDGGFTGPVLTTPGTAELAAIVLTDSARLQEEADYANRRGFSKHSPALPLYTEESARRALGQFRPVSYEQPFEAAPGAELRLLPAGHILGSATVTLTLDGPASRTLFFRGDVHEVDDEVVDGQHTDHPPILDERQPPDRVAIEHGDGLVQIRIGRQRHEIGRHDLVDIGVSRELLGELPFVHVERLHRERGWEFEPSGRGSQRAVPSPEPLAIVELRTIERLANQGVLVVCAGGGGIPVRCDPGGTLHGVEAVIDKDRTAALLATLLGADLLLFLTDVTAVADHWGSAFVRPLDRVTPSQLRPRHFDESTMGTKVESACRFVEQTGKRAAIGAMTDAASLCAGTTGTQIVASDLLEDFREVPDDAVL